MVAVLWSNLGGHRDKSDMISLGGVCDGRETTLL